MQVLAAFFSFVAFVVISLFISAVALKVIWYLTEMGDWTGLGSLPWGPAVFLALFPASFTLRPPGR